MGRNNTLLARMGFDDPDQRTDEHDRICQYLTQPDVAQEVCSSFGCEFAGSKMEVAINKGDGKYKTTVGFVDVVYSVVFHECSIDVHPGNYYGKGHVPAVQWHWDLSPIEQERRVRQNELIKDTRELWNAVDYELRRVNRDISSLRRERDSLNSPYSLIGGIRFHLLEERMKGLFDIKSAYDFFLKEFSLSFGERKKAFVIEVKVKPRSMGDIMRQLSLYMEYDLSWGGGYQRSRLPILVTRQPISSDSLEMLSSRGIAHIQLGEKYDKWLQDRRRGKKAAVPHLTL